MKRERRKSDDIALLGPQWAETKSSSGFIPSILQVKKKKSQGERNSFEEGEAGKREFMWTRI